jgi:quercetin dioxygenase-like cupin family protein
MNRPRDRLCTIPATFSIRRGFCDRGLNQIAIAAEDDSAGLTEKPSRMIPAATLTRWPSPEPPSEIALVATLRDSGLRPSRWSNGPGDRYGAHSHPYHKVLYCLRGGIRFDVVDSGESLDLRPGDRLDIPPGATHSAIVGPSGVTCLEAPRAS